MEKVLGFQELGTQGMGNGMRGRVVYRIICALFLFLWSGLFPFIPILWFPPCTVDPLLSTPVIIGCVGPRLRRITAKETWLFFFPWRSFFYIGASQRS